MKQEQLGIQGEPVMEKKGIGLIVVLPHLLKNGLSWEGEHLLFKVIRFIMLAGVSRELLIGKRLLKLFISITRQELRLL